MPVPQRVADIVDLRIARFDAVISSKVIAHTIAQKESLNIQNGQVMELFCTASGRPFPEINWFKDGQVVTSKSASNNFIVTRFGATSSLRITDVKTSDSGTYACRAENINGHIGKWVYVTVSPKMDISTASSTNSHSLPTLKKQFPKSVCYVNPCKIGVCFERDNGTSYECKCPFPYNGNKCENNILITGNRRNSSGIEEKSVDCKKNNITVNDHLFTIFETVLVCVIAFLFLGIICYIFRRKYCCFFNKSKIYHRHASQAIQAEINNFILVRDVGINVNEYYFEHGCDRLMPVAYKRNVSMIYQESGFPEISQYPRIIPTQCSSFSSPILFDETFLKSQYSSYLESIAHNKPMIQSVYCNKSIIQDNNYDSTEDLNTSRINTNSKSESGICSCFDYNPHLHPMSSTLLIYNETVTPSLSCNDPLIQNDNG